MLRFEEPSSLVTPMLERNTHSPAREGLFTTAEEIGGEAVETLPP